MRFPVVSGRAARRAFERLGFEFHHMSGSHAIMVRHEPPSVAAIPMHVELKVGTLLGIMRRAGVERDDFLRVL